MEEEPRDNTFEAYMQRLKGADELTKARVLHDAEQYGDITGEQYQILIAAAYG